MNRRRGVLATLAALLVLGGTGYGVNQIVSGGGPPPPPGSANVFVDGGSGTCQRAPTATAYNSASACSSLDAAYRAANPGDQVLVSCPGAASSCSYPDQDILHTSAKALSFTCRWGVTGQNAFNDGAVAQNLTGCITFAPQAGVSPIFDSISIHAPYVFLNGINLSIADNKGNIAMQNLNGAGATCDVPNTETDIIVKDMTATQFFMKGTAYASLINDTFNGINWNNGSDGSHSSAVTRCNNADPLGATMHTNHIFLDGDTIENIIWDSSGEHLEGVHWWSCNYCVINRITLYNVGQYGLNFQGDQDMRQNVTVQNSVFYPACYPQNYTSTGGCNGILGPGNNGQSAVDMGQSNLYTTNHWVVRFNSFSYDDYPTGFSDSNPVADAQLYGNIMGHPNVGGGACAPRIARGLNYSYNVEVDAHNFGGAACGTNSTLVSFQTNFTTTMEKAYTSFHSATQQNYSPIAGSVSVDLLVPASLPGVPTADYLANPRPDVAATNVDAGAYEKQGS